MEGQSTSQKSLIISYLTLRKVIGLLGFTFPFVLFLGALIIFGTSLQNSLSAYYHTGMQNVFVGVLCVIGFFMLSYRGYTCIDNIAGDLACIFAVCAALFPTTARSSALGGLDFIGYVHFIFSALFFVTLIYFSLFLFTKTVFGSKPQGFRPTQLSD